MLPIGTAVSINHTTLSGEIVAYELTDNKTKLAYKVAYTDHEGVAQERSFTADQLTVKE